MFLVICEKGKERGRKRNIDWLPDTPFWASSLQAGHVPRRNQTRDPLVHG